MDVPGSGDPSTGFLRQRRNLIVASVVSAFVKFGDVALGDRVSLFGATLTIREPTALYWALVIAVGYFSIRYYQYWTKEVGQKFWPTLRNAFIGRANSYVYAQLETQAVPQKFRTSTQVAPDGYFPARGLPKTFRHPLSETDIGGHSVDADQFPSGMFPVWDVPIPAGKRFELTAGALVDVVCRSPYFTDYYLPFFLAAVAVACLASL